MIANTKKKDITLPDLCSEVEIKSSSPSSASSSCPVRDPLSWLAGRFLDPAVGWDKETPYAQEGNHSSISAGNNKLYLACLDTRWGSSDILLLGQSLCVSWGDKVRLRLNRTGVGDRLVVSSLALRHHVWARRLTAQTSSTESWLQGLCRAFFYPPEVLVGKALGRCYAEIQMR